jgi:hypothetical protein
MKIPILLVAVLLCFCLTLLFACATVPNSSKLEKSARVLQSLIDLRKLAVRESRSESNEDLLRRRVCAAIGEQHSPDQLAKLAVLCRTMAYPQSADDVRSDRVFDLAYWRCIEMITTIGGNEGADAIKQVEAFSNLQGGEILMFQQALHTAKP